MTTPILVTGGTGRLGGRLVPRLVELGAGREVRVLTRGRRPDQAGPRYLTGDLDTGAGVDAAVDGVGTIVHCAGNGRGDEATTRTLAEAAARAGSPHLVFVSVVGADRVPVTTAFDRALFGYFAAKLAAEKVVAGSGLPWTILRATQFHDLVLLVVRALAKPPLALVPAASFQPVDTGEVAARLAELAMGAPAGLLPDLAGPRVYGLDDLVRSYLAASGRRRPVVRVRVPGGAARAVRAGAVLAKGGTLGQGTWEAYLAQAVGRAPARQEP
jgi:uncharacterized protein YbjT (DUF2867 family)